MKRIWISNIALVGVLLLGIAYVLFYVVRIDPTKKFNTVSVNLEATGGLLERADVTYLGVAIGQVKQISLRKDGVTARIELDDAFQVPVDSQAVVAGLSAVGEQHLDLRPRTTGGPYLANGAKIEQGQTHTPRPFAELLAHVGSISDQLDPEQLSIVVDELAKATDGGADDVRRILTGGRFLLTGLEDVLPETVRILDNGHTTLNTVADLTDELQRLGAAGKKIGATLKASDGDIRALLDASPKTLDLVRDIVVKDGPSLGALFGDLSNVTGMVSRRIPAFSEYLPGLIAVGNALPIVSRDGQLYAIADPYGKPMCDYGTPRRSPTIGGSPDPYTNGHCKERRPDMQQRGAYNAPRPGGETAGGSGSEAASTGSTSARTQAKAQSSQDATSWVDGYLGMVLRGW